LRHTAAFCGPNPHSQAPVIVAELIGTSAVPDAASERCTILARAIGHTLDEPVASDEMELAHFLARWALALLNKADAWLDEAGAFRAEEGPFIYLAYHESEIARAALELAIDCFNRTGVDPADALDRQVETFVRAARAEHPDFQTAYLVRAAKADGLPYLRFQSTHRVWQFGWGCRRELFFESEPEGDSAIGWKIARDKLASKEVFAALGIRTPPYRIIACEADLAAVPDTIGWPCVVKPTTTGRGRGVTTDVADPQHLRAAVRRAAELAKGPVFVERQVMGDIFRISVLRGRVSVIRRLGISVTGDGRLTIEQLIAGANLATEQRRAADPNSGPIVVDDRVLDQLSIQGLGLDDVPAKGRKVILNRNATRAEGGGCVDETAAAHPDILQMAVTLASALGLEVCGIDFISADISRSCAEEGAVLEINTTPGLRIAQFVGMSPEDVGRRVLGDGPGRIRTCLVIADEPSFGQLAGCLRFGDRQGWVMAPRCGLGSMRLGESSDDPDDIAQGVRRILRNPLAESLTVICTSAQLTRAGLPVDRFDRILACRASLEAGWREALAKTTDDWLDLADANEVVAELRRTGDVAA
jgi:D-alanine-D-alanine ligase-like ATP-grasp enzyme